MTFQEQIKQGIPNELPKPKPFDSDINHAPKRKEILTVEEKKLALRNALRYFEPKHHAVLIDEFSEELETFEQAFLTGSAAEVTPLAEIGPWRFEVGALTRQLASDYSDLVNGRL